MSLVILTQLHLFLPFASEFPSPNPFCRHCQAHLSGHAFHTYSLTSPDETVSFQFQHNVCGRRFYAEGSVDAALFLAKQIEKGTEKKLFDMVDVLNAGAMR